MHRSIGVPTVLAGVACMVIACAGVCKLVWFDVFAPSVETWTLLPRWSVPVVAFGVPAIEVALGIVWFTGAARARVAAAALALVVVYTGAAVVHYAQNVFPECRCFGRLFEWRSTGGFHVRWLLLNAFLACLLIPKAWEAFGRTKPAFRPPAGTPARARPAFTLIEMLCVIAIVGVLLALAVPLILQTRAHAKASRVLQCLRQHAGVFTLYAADHADAMPVFTNRREAAMIAGGACTGRALRYFEGFNYWHCVLAEKYYTVAEASAVFYVGGRVAPGGQTSYWYSAAFLADPEFWNPSTRTNPSQWNGTRLSSVLFPDRKGLLAQLGVRSPDWKVLERWSGEAAFTDGSTRTLSAGDLIPGVWTGEGNYDGSFFHIMQPLMHTVDGIRGRDVR